MQEKRSLYHLYDALEVIMETARQNQNDAQKAIESMYEETNNFGKMSNETKKLIHEEIKTSISSITDKVEGNLITKFREANRQAEIAGKNYKMVSFWIPIKFFALLTIGGVCTIAGVTMIVLKMVPTFSEIENRFETMKKIELLISKNKVQLSTCDGRKCVRVNKKEWETGNRKQVWK
jgi:hypothetical protein